MHYLRFRVWPWLKVRLRWWWWIVKYRGRKNVPRELVFGEMSKSVKRMSDNLMMALRHVPDDLGEREKSELIDLIREAGELEKEFEKAKNSDADSAKAGNK